MNVLKTGDKVICFVDYTAEEKTIKKTVEQLHNVFILDRSGSMYGDIDTAIENTKAALRIIPETDIISVIWFSGAGQCKTLIKGAKNDSNLVNLLDSLKSTVGLTCFSEPLQEVSEVIADLKAMCPNFSISLFTDGCPVVPWSEKEEIDRINVAIDGWKDEVLALNTIGYGNYYNAELLRDMSSKTLFGQFIHNSKITELSNIFTHNYSKLSGMVLETIEVLSDQAEIVYLNSKTVQYFGKELSLRTIDKVGNTFILYGDSDFEFEVNGVTYKTKELDSKACSDNQTALYALAYNLYYRGKKQESLEILAGMLGDKALVDGQINAFTNTERADYQRVLEYSVFDESVRNAGTCDANYLPKEDAFCVMDLLRMLAEAEGTQYIYATDYKRIGLAQAESNNYFKRDEGIIATDFKELVLNKDKVNVSVRSKITGKVALNPVQAERVGLNPEINSYIYRTQTIIKDGYLNMDKVQFAVTPSTLKQLQQLAVENEGFKFEVTGAFPSTDVIKKELVTIDLTTLPVINKKYVTQVTDLSVLFANTLESLKLEAEQKMANYILKDAQAELGEEKYEFAKLTDDQVQLLKDYGVDSKLAYVGVNVTKAEKGEDYYETRKLVYSIKGCSSLPSGADVLTKLASGKSLNYCGELMASWYQGLQQHIAKLGDISREEAVRAKITYCESQLASIKKQLFEKRMFICTLNMGIVLTNYWFEGAITDDKGNVTYTEGDKTLIIKATKEKVYY